MAPTCMILGMTGWMMLMKMSQVKEKNIIAPDRFDVGYCETLKNDLGELETNMLVMVV